MQLYPISGFNYQFLLHAHSHFAFAGWMFFSIAILITHTVSGNISLKAYKTVFVFALVSAFGMLVTFSLQGYKFASIAFSTLFILVTYRFAYLVFRNTTFGMVLTDVSRKLIYSGLAFLCLSSLGPFSLAPIMASGLKDTPLYQNAIYFYLHFQMNGFMLFASLGLFASMYLTRPSDKSSRLWLKLFIFSTLPLFLMFTLWTKPPASIWIVAFLSAVMNLISWMKLCFYYKSEAKKFSFLVNTALLAITFKTTIQVFVCLPVVGEWAFLNRNLIIGYVHLLTLACIVPLILDQFIKKTFLLADRHLQAVNRLYITAVVVYLILLFVQPLLLLFLITIPNYQAALFWLSVVFLFIGGTYLVKSVRHTPVS